MKKIKIIIKSCIFLLIFVLLTSCLPEQSFEDIFGVDTNITIENKTIYNINGIKITSKGIYEQVEKKNGFVQAMLFLKFDVENTSSDNIYLTSEYVTINDIMVESGGIEYFNAGTSGELNIQIFPSDENGITIINRIGLSLLVTNSDTHEKITKTGVINLYSSNDTDYVEPNLADGTLVYSGKEVNIYIKILDGRRLQLYIENKLNQTINVSAYCTSINGKPFEGFENNAHIIAGKKDFLNIGYSESDINKNAPNKFGINIAIHDDTGKNLAFNQIIKDLGTVYVTIE